MLIQLRIRHFALMDSLTLTLAPHMTVFTGETGAGKSLWVDALLLLLGGKLQGHVIREGHEFTEISADFTPPDDHPAWHALKEHSRAQTSKTPLSSEPSLSSPRPSCITLSRRIRKDGKSTCSIQGLSCTLQDLKSLGQLLVTTCTQHEHLKLLKRETQLAYVERFGGAEILDLHHQVSHLFDQSAALKKAHASASLLQAQQQERQALLDYQLQELEAAHIAELDFPAVDAELTRLTHAISLQQTTEQLGLLLSEDDQSLATQTHRSIGLLEAACRHDPQLSESLERLHSIAAELQDVGQSLTRYAQRISFDPERLQALEHQYEHLSTLARKHRVEVQALPAHYQSMLDEKLKHSSSTERLQALAAEIEQTDQAYQQAAQALSRARTETSKGLISALSALMADIGMPHAQFNIILTPLEAPSRDGLEACEFWISTNPGQAPQPLHQVVSGGELSRLNLAFQCVMSSMTTPQTWIFDEMDVGISGAIAAQIGRLMHALSTRVQVLCISHLPQVASCADHHFRVFKALSSDEHMLPHTRIEEVTGEARIRALAQLLGGDRVSETTLAHAREYLSKA